MQSSVEYQSLSPERNMENWLAWLLLQLKYRVDSVQSSQPHSRGVFPCKQFLSFDSIIFAGRNLKSGDQTKFISAL